MTTARVGPSDWLWKEGGGYYTETAGELVLRPILPDIGRLRDRRLFELFERHCGLGPGSRVLEAGCGRSRWLPFLGLRLGCRATGIDIEPHAADLASANLRGAGAEGDVVIGDAFALHRRQDLRGAFDAVYSMGVLEHFPDVVGRISSLALYLKPGGRILTTVPNLQGLNWLLQRLGDLRTLQAHVVYDTQALVKVHEEAGFQTIAAGYAGFFDAYLSSSAGSASRLRRATHAGTCRALGRGAEAWLRLLRGRGTPEMRYLAPHVFYVGRRGPGSGREAGVLR
jgi:2-polyprenyl-6-hydroxyphenyl methylase/3-demethylubiquinone-9 3-methyltransferase